MRGLSLTNVEEKEKYEIILKNYEKMLREMKEIEISPRNNIRCPELELKEAICIANIVKITFLFLGKTNQRLINLCERCRFLADQLDINEKEEWFKEFCDIYNEIRAI